MTAKVYTLMVHSPTHSPEDLIINKDVFTDMVVGDFIKLYLFEGEQSQKTTDPLILKVNILQSIVGRLEISISKSIADPLNMKPFSRVVVEKIAPEDARVDFVELSFRKQFLTRGNMWRFKNAINGKSVHVHQTVQIDGVQAQIQELGMNCVHKKSGIIFDNSKFIFRSRSARIIWLVQVSKEMWEFDENGDLYFEKFLSKFVNPLLEKWKALQVTHQLSVIFFARSIYLDRVEFIPELSSKLSLQQHNWGGNNSINNTTKCQDFYKVVIENTSDIDKVATVKALKEEFWSFAKGVGWNLPNSSLGNAPMSRENSFDNLPTLASPHCVPSDAYDGNFLESINTTLNLMDKHYMDRDLSRSGNSIVMISAGTGIFNVKPQLSQITKQRMMDTGIGIDFVSLSQPPMHTVPLFHVDCKGEGVGNFYEVPHWINICFVDCLKDSSTNLKLNMGEVSSRRQRASSNSQKRTTEFDRSPRRSYRWTGLDFDDETSSINSYQQSTADSFGITFKPLPFPSILKGHLKAAKYASSAGIDASNKQNNQNQTLVQGLSVPRLLKKNLKFKDDLSVLSSNAGSLTTELSVKDKYFHRLYEWGKLPFKQIFQPVSPMQFLDREDVNSHLPHTSSKSAFDDFSSHSLKKHLECEDRRKLQSTFEIGSSSDVGSKLINESIPELSSSVGGSSDGGSFFSSSMERFHGSHLLDPSSPQRMLSQGQQQSSSLAQQDNCFWTVVQCNSSTDSPYLATTDENSADLDKIYESMQSFDSGVFQSTVGPSVGNRPDSNCGSILNQPTRPFSQGIASNLAGSPHTTNYFSSMHRNSSSSNISPGGFNQVQLSTTTAERDVGTMDHGPFSENYVPIDNNFPPRLERKLSDAASSLANFHRRLEPSSSFIKRRDSDDSTASPSQLSSIHLGPRQTMMSVSNNKSMAMLVKQHNLNHTYSSSNNMNNVSSSPAAGGGMLGGNGQNLKSQGLMEVSAKALIREFRRRAQVNPFRKDEGSNYVKSRTHNRRRWSHVFPTGERSDTNGLNWKSLSQPAILPLTTDYLPPVSELLSKYDIQTFYPLIIDPIDSPFKSPEALLQEMVCHRLSMEFQLVEGVDISSYHNFGRGSFASSNRASFITSTKSKILIKGAEERNVLYILTMGHRIQFLEYDYATQQVHVTQLRSRQGINDAERTANYSYEIYVPQFKAFKTVSQTFYQFPTPEYLWNKADGILLGTVEIDFAGDVTKTKRLRFAIMSDRQQDTNASFFGKIEKLVAFCNKQCKSSSTDDNFMRVSMLGDDADSSQTHRKKDFSVVNITLKDSIKEPKWAFLKYDKKISASRIFHVELHWIVCDSWLVDDFVNVLFRRCNTWGMRIIQIPEFFCTANMKLHPFRAQPYIPVPQCQRAIQCEGYPSAVSLVSRLFLENSDSSAVSNKWWRDDDRLTDWTGIEDVSLLSEEIGLVKQRNGALNNQSNKVSRNTNSDASIGSVLTMLSTQHVDQNIHRSESIVPELGAAPSTSELTNALAEGTLYHIRPVVTQLNSLALGLSMPALRPPIPASLLSSIAASTKKDFRSIHSHQKKCDIQYMHGYGLASLRQGKRGFLWLSNAGARISDVNLTPDEKKRLTLANMTEFTQHCSSVGDCFEILVDIIEDMLLTSRVIDKIIYPGDQLPSATYGSTGSTEESICATQIELNSVQEEIIV